MLIHDVRDVLVSPIPWLLVVDVQVAYEHQDASPWALIERLLDIVCRRCVVRRYIATYYVLPSIACD